MRLSQLLRCYSKLPKDYSNLPESYVKRVFDENFTYWKTPKGINYQQREMKRRKFNYGMHRPWSQEFIVANAAHTPYKRVYMEPISEWTVLRGDRVEILVGKDKGKHGIVNYIVKERNWVTVEGLNCEIKYLGKTKDYPGVAYKDEQPLLVTNEVKLVDPSDNKPTNVEWRYTEDGKKVRVSVRTGRVIPLPVMAFETIDYKEKRFYSEQPKDTVAAELQKVTFEPKIMSFEQEIMQEMGIVENRISGKTYWY